MLVNVSSNTSAVSIPSYDQVEAFQKGHQNIKDLFSEPIRSLFLVLSWVKAVNDYRFIPFGLFFN